MSNFHEYFLCDACECKDFSRIYNFSLKFHGVNFSENLIYDTLTDEIYQCAKCMKSFTVEQVMDGLAEIKKRYKGADLE